MRRAAAKPSERSLEWRVAAAWIALVMSLLIVPGVDSRAPRLLRLALPWHAADFGLAAVALVLTLQPLARGAVPLKLLAAPCAVIAGWHIAAWVVLLTLEPSRRAFPF